MLWNAFKEVVVYTMVHFRKKYTYSSLFPSPLSYMLEQLRFLSKVPLVWHNISLKLTDSLTQIVRIRRKNTTLKFWIQIPWSSTIFFPVFSLEPVCCKKQQKSSWPVTGLWNRGPLKIRQYQTSGMATKRMYFVRDHVWLETPQSILPLIHV